MNRNRFSLFAWQSLSLLLGICIFSGEVEQKIEASQKRVFFQEDRHTPVLIESDVRCLPSVLVALIEEYAGDQAEGYALTTRYDLPVALQETVTHMMAWKDTFYFTFFAFQANMLTRERSFRKAHAFALNAAVTSCAFEGENRIALKKENYNHLDIIELCENPKVVRRIQTRELHINSMLTLDSSYVAYIEALRCHAIQLLCLDSNRSFIAAEQEDYGAGYSIFFIKASDDRVVSWNRYEIRVWDTGDRFRWNCIGHSQVPPPDELSFLFSPLTMHDDHLLFTCYSHVKGQLFNWKRFAFTPINLGLPKFQHMVSINNGKKVVVLTQLEKQEFREYEPKMRYRLQ